MNDAPKKSIRGSALLLVGRCLSLALNLLVQVITVRYLTKLDYGLFAFSFTLAEFATLAIVFGMDTSLAKFVPLYHERGDLRRMFGAILLAVVSIFCLGTAVVLPVFGLSGWLSGLLGTDPRSYWVVAALILLGPLNALNNLVDTLAATFAGAWPIFIRKFLLGPGLKLLVVVSVIVTDGGLFALAVGHVVASAVALVLYTVQIVSALNKQGLMRHLRLWSLTIPLQEILAFSIPQVGVDLAFMLRAFMLVILLQLQNGTASIAEYWAVLPIARLSDVVIVAFSHLFIPSLSRLCAREEWETANLAYWGTATWITVLTFPFFAFTIACAEPVTGLLFGERYTSSAMILPVLSCGLFFHAALGLNGQALWVLGKVRLVVLLETITTIVAAGLYYGLATRYGSMGAALATSLTLVVYAALKQAGMLLATDVVKFNWQHTKLLGVVVLVLSFVWGLTAVWKPPIYIGVLLAVFSWAIVIATNRQVLEIAETFPELMRIPLLRRLCPATKPESEFVTQV